MKKIVKTLITIIFSLIIILIITVLLDHNAEGERENKENIIDLEKEKKSKGNSKIGVPIPTDYFVNDSLYEWSDKKLDWVSVGILKENKKLDSVETPNISDTSERIHLEWDLLMNIQYRLKYFKYIDMEMFAPEFNEKIEAINGRQVVIKGFIIPFDEDGELIALSYNSYSSCFFCGNASPASVITLHMKDPTLRYELDDYRRIKGKLLLNYNDTEQFYYILENAVEL